MPKPRVRGRSSERIAKGILEKLGYEILETNKTVTVDEAKAFEVDILAINSEREKCCAEVKAGQAGVSDVRQVFADSKLLGLKPILICKGFANEAAEAVARELQVRMIRLSEYYILLEPEELEIIVRTAVQDVLDEYGFYPLPPWEAIRDDDWKVMESIAGAESFQEAAQLLSLSVEELGQKIGTLRDHEVFPRREQDFADLKRYSQQLIQRCSLKKRIETIENLLRKIEEYILEVQ
jgi:predicted RecB family endonuclease